jgi:hypothetical protein
MEEAASWIGDIGIVCGAVSGGLVALDFDVKNGDRVDPWILDVNAIKPELLSKLYMETTPSGGRHICYRSSGEFRNKPLACNTDGKAMIETRGEGGYIIVAPSIGYSVRFNRLSQLRPLTIDEESILLAVAEGFNEYEKPEYRPAHSAEVSGDTVFNRYDSVTDPVPLLEAHGWTVVYGKKGKAHLRRPDKRDGISASWNHIPGRFYCFSSSTQFESETPYKPSAVYAILEHGGDFRAACRALAAAEKI